MKYFSLLPKTTFELENKEVTMVDISTRFKLLDYIKNNQDTLIQLDYTIKEEMRPEQVTYELYQTYNYTWILLALNSVFNIYEDWVLPQSVVDKRMIKKYGSIRNAMNTPVAWYDKYGYEVSSYSRLKVRTEMAFDRIMKENERKKYIKVFTRISVQRIQNDFQAILKEI